MGKGKRHRKSSEPAEAAEPKPTRARAPVDVEPPLDLPPPAARKRANIMISLTIGLSILIPLSYYMSDDRRDERYAWRMFSAQRAEVCDATVVEDLVGDAGKTIRKNLSLVSTIHQAWVSGLKLGRPDIVDRFLAYRCEQPDVRSVQLTRDCRSGAGRPLPPDVLTRHCAPSPTAEAATP